MKETPANAPGRRHVCTECGTRFNTDPADAMQDCPSCGEHVHLRKCFLKSLAGNTMTERFLDGPLIGSPDYSFGRLRGAINRLTLTSSSGQGYNTGYITNVYYLDGQERAAVTRFIEANYGYMSQAIEGRRNPLTDHWNEYLARLAEEQYYLHGYDETPPHPPNEAAPEATDD